MELAREKSFQCHRMLKKKIKFCREEQNKHLLLHDCTWLAKLNFRDLRLEFRLDIVISDLSEPGVDATTASWLSIDLRVEATPSSLLLFCFWNRAARSLSRFIFFSDFVLGAVIGFRFDGLGWKWTLSGWPRYAEKLTKVFPFIDSMMTRALVPDLQHLQNSLNVENKKASSLLFIVLDVVLSEPKTRHSETTRKRSGHLALTHYYTHYYFIKIRFFY